MEIPKVGLLREEQWDRGTLGSLQPPWQVRLGKLINRGAGLRPLSQTLALAVLDGISEKNVRVEAHVDVSGRFSAHAGIVARYRGPGDGNAYAALLVHDDGRYSADLWRHAGDQWCLLQSMPIRSASGILALHVYDTTLAVSLDGILLHQVEDGHLEQPGALGVRALGGCIRGFRAERLRSRPAMLLPGHHSNPPNHVRAFRRTIARLLNLVDRSGTALATAVRNIRPPKAVDTHRWQRNNRSRKPRILLFLGWFYAGGVWNAVKDLVTELTAINAEQQKLELVLGLHPEFFDRPDLQQVARNVPLVPVEMGRLCRRAQAELIRREGLSCPANARYSFFLHDEGETAALEADAWLALTDRFELPLVPARPYGMFVYDMIQRHAPEGFSAPFFRMMAEGMAPAARAARQILVTSPATQSDVAAEYGIHPERIRMLPVACEPQRSLGMLAPEPVELPRQPFLLNVTNAAPHKGAETMLRAYGRLRTRLGDARPLLVLCGWRTDRFSRAGAQPDDVEYYAHIRRLVQKLELEESRDVVFLGYVNDRQLVDLYERCAVVVNAAKFDNGSFSMIEARYFGKPVVSTRYPASEFLSRRFDVPARFFPVDDAAALAEALEAALGEFPVTGRDLDVIRAGLAAPQLSYRRYAEGVYQALIELATSESGARRPPVPA